MISVVVLTTCVTYSAEGAGIPKRAISSSGNFSKSDLPPVVAYGDQSNSWTASQTMTLLNSFLSGTLGGTPNWSSAQTFPSPLTIGTSNSVILSNSGLGASYTFTFPSYDSKIISTAQTCSTDQILKYASNSSWICSTPSAAGITSINTDATAAQQIGGATGNLTVSNDTGGIHNIKLGPNVVVTSGSQTLSGKTLSSPTLSGTASSLSDGGTNIGTPSVRFGSIYGTTINGTTVRANTLSASTGSAITVSSASTFSAGAKVNGFSTTQRSITVADSPYTASSTDDTIYVDDSGGSVTVNLPSAVGLDGKIFTIKKTSSSLNTVTIAGTSGQTIDGASSITLNNAQEKITVQSNNANWSILTPRGDDVDSFRIRGSTANRYFSSAVSPYSDTVGGTPSATLLSAYPFIVSKTINVDRIGLAVSTLLAGSTCRVGIYADSGNTAPSTLVSGSDAGTLNTASTGLKTNTISVTLQANNLYWLAYECSTAATLKLMYIPLGYQPNILGLVPTGASVASGTGYTATNTYGALPASFPSAGRTIISTAPIEIVVRLAS